MRKQFMAPAMSVLTLLATNALLVNATATPAAAVESGSYYQEEWGVIGRNTLGASSAVLRLGPWGRDSITSPEATVPPPYGTGSLGIIVSSGTDKIEFGNETDFADMPLSAITTLKYWIFEGSDLPLVNVQPNIIMEVDPNLNPAVNYTSLVYLPNLATPPSAPATRLPSTWQQYDAGAAGGKWYATNAATATATGCTQGTPCSFSTLKEKLPDAVITMSLGIGKGRDNPFVGAVDGLQVNNALYDFEPFGVRKFIL